MQNKTKQKSFRPPFNTVEILKKYGNKEAQPMKIKKKDKLNPLEQLEK